MQIIGIDLGKQGYIVELDSEKKTVRALKMPFFPDDSVNDDVINRYFNLKGADWVICEQMNIPPKFSAYTAFSFGVHCGEWKKILKNVRYKQLSAVTWQKIMFEGFGEKYKDSKQKSIAAFHRLNPYFKAPESWGRRKIIDHNFSDAFLIAAFGMIRLGVSLNIEWKYIFIGE